jgi:UDP-N-acetylmuramoyl-tripeptide--D-alanyl-D-alanine ligase
MKMKKNELKSYFSIYLPTAPYVFVYMLQQVENNADEFLKWVNRVPNYRHVIKRKKLVVTKKAAMLVVLAYAMAVVVLAVVILMFKRGQYPFAVGLFVIQPAVVILFLAYINKLGVKLIAFKRRKDYGIASAKLQAHKATKIVVLGSYGKTTAKELLATVLKEGKKVASTPGNMNVPISHARWIINKLTGEEEVLIFELGEGEPGDIKRFCELLHPDIAVLTGYAPNHLDGYKTTDALKEDLRSIEDFVDSENLYVAEQAAEAVKFKKDIQVFGTKKSDGWDIKNIKVAITGTSFDMTHDKQKVSLHSSLIGEHNVAPLALSFTLAQKLGVSQKEAEAGIAKTMPFEHRMQAKEVNGAWLVDDTYNGNLEGIRAGLELLKSVKATRKMYVTPGLVEQGTETEKVHTEIGHLVAKAEPDVVVFMHNSVCHIMEHALKEKGYKGIIRVESDPLEFYTNIQYELAGGDVVLMQNDWTDNYA